MSAFGKDQKALKGVNPFGGNTSFSQRTAFLMRSESAQRQRRGGGGGRFADVFKPTKTGLDEGRLVPGNYTFRGCDEKKNIYEYPLEYWPYVEHYDGRTERSSICSGGVLHNFKDHDPCHGCDLFFSTMEKGADGKKKSRVSKRDMFVFNFLHYHPYHKIEQVDRNTGTVRTNDKGEPYFEWVQCEGRGCKMCEAKCEVMPARMQKWEMGFTHFKALTQEYANTIANSCTSCRSKDSIFSEAWLCQSCGEPLIELSSTSLKDEDIANIVSQPTTCSHCKTEGFLAEAYACKGCQTAKRATIFDVDLKMKRMENSKDGGNQTTLIVSSYSEPRPVDQRFVELVKPFDLDKLYVGTDLAYQEKIFQIAPQQQGQAQPGGLQRTPVNTGFRRYGEQQGGGGAGTPPTSGPNYGR